MKVRELKSESAKWEQLANEAIADAGKWKRRTRQLEAALLTVLPYAEQESQGLWAHVRDDAAITDEAEAAESAISSAYKLLDKGQS